jgi:hypothetical protein
MPRWCRSGWPTYQYLFTHSKLSQLVAPSSCGTLLLETWHRVLEGSICMSRLGSLVWPMLWEFRVPRRRAYHLRIRLILLIVWPRTSLIRALCTILDWASSASSWILSYLRWWGANGFSQFQRWRSTRSRRWQRRPRGRLLRRRGWRPSFWNLIVCTPGLWLQGPLRGSRTRTGEGRQLISCRASTSYKSKGKRSRAKLARCTRQTTSMFRNLLISKLPSRFLHYHRRTFY